MSENSKTLLVSDLLDEEAPVPTSASFRNPEAVVAVPDAEYRPVDPDACERYSIPTDIGLGMSLSKRSQALMPYGLRMYCDHYPNARIARLLNVKRDTVTNWIVSHGWVKKRAELEARYHDAIISQKAQTLGQIMSSAIDVIAKAMKNVSKQDEITLKDARDVSEIFKNMDKVLRLTHGAPTEIHEKRHLDVKVPRTVAEIREVLRSDPFMEIDVTPEPVDESTSE